MKMNFFKRLMAVALVLCMVCSMALVVSAEETATNTANLSLSVSRSGNTVSASVSISASSALLGAEFKVNFDNSKLTLTESSKTGFPNTTVNTNANDKGFVKYVGYSDSAVSVSGTILTMTFSVKEGASGDAAFSISGALIVDENDKDCTVSTSGGASVEIADYKINIESATNGTITSSTTSSASGQTVTLTTAPAAGYGVDTVTVMGSNGAAVTVTSDGNTHTFTMPKANVTVTATFKAVDYTITKGTVTNGTLTIDKASAKAGETITVTATANEGYEVGSVTATGVTLSGGTNGVYTFTMPTADVTVNATFKAKTFTITKSAVTNGSLTVAANAAFGDTVKITATPASGYKVIKVTVTDAAGKAVTVSGSGNNYTFKMPAGNVTVAATFDAVDYTITKGSVTNGTLTVDKAAANVGEKITITATPNEGYEIASVTATGVTLSGGTNGVYTFTMPAANVTVNATFKTKSFTISKASVSNGSLTVAASAAVGDTVKITATPASGYNVAKVTVTDAAGKTVAVSGSGNNYTFKMPAGNVTVAAEFEKIPFTVTLNKTYNGTASVDKTNAYYGETITIKVEANDNYVVEYVSVLDSSNKSVSVKTKMNGDYSFTMPASDVKITVGFMVKSFNINADAGKNGKLKVAGSAGYGSTVEFTVEPDEGYEIESLKVTTSGGKEITVNNSNDKYSFKMPASKVNIKVSFAAIEYKIEMKSTENGTFTVSNDAANFGDKIKVVANPDENYQVNSVTITDSKGNLVSYTGEGEEYSFDMPSSDVTVQVTFEKIPDITYAVTIAQAQNGKISVSKDVAGAGSVVTITCTPDEGYMVDTVTVLDADGNAVEVSGSENVHAFAMPEGNATVTVTFKVDPNYQAEVPTTAPVQGDDNTGSSASAWIVPGAILLLIVVILVMIVVILTKKKK